MIREFFLTLVQSAALHTRDRIIEVLKAMPADATVDDAIERLVFLAKIESGLAELDRSEGVGGELLKSGVRPAKTQRF